MVCVGYVIVISTIYHPQTQVIIKKINQLVSKILHYIIHPLGHVSKWKSYLATMEFAMKPLLARSTIYNLFFSNYDYHPVVPSELIKSDELIRNELVSFFV